MTTEPIEPSQAREEALEAAQYLLSAPAGEDKDSQTPECIQKILKGFPGIPGILCFGDFHPQEETKLLFETLEQIAEGENIHPKTKEMLIAFITAVPSEDWNPEERFWVVRACFVDDNIFYKGKYYPTVELENKSKTLEQLLEENS